MRSSVVWSWVAAVALAGCGAEEVAAPAAQDGPYDISALMDGKADNYISSNAREFLLGGHAHFVLPEGFAAQSAEEQAATLDKLAQQRLGVVTRSVRSKIDALIGEANSGLSAEDEKYFTYLRRNASELEAVEVAPDGRGRLRFQVELVGSLALANKLATEEVEGGRGFQVEVKDWSDTEGEAVTVLMEESPSKDAFPKYNELFADGVYDIAIHFGGDYNAGRFDLETAKWTVETLLAGGWQSEGVSSFEDLTIDSAPFVHKLSVDGREIEARVSIYHSDMVEGELEGLLSERMRESFARRDVVIYSGHAGEGAGFILDYQPRHEIGAGEFAALPLAEKYQIYIFDGCQTYRTYVDDLMKNPRKTFDNVDIVTTVNTTPFSAGYQLIHQFLYWLTLTDQEGRHLPLSWQTMLRGLNTKDWADVHYGVHGIDNDPTLNPNGGAELACAACDSNDDCGGGGNFCLNFAGGAACGVACAEDAACPQGSRCAPITDDPEQFYIPRQCVPVDLTCQ
jgi:hypothetical protein